MEILPKLVTANKKLKFVAMAMSAAQLLDELMGKDRNRAPGEPSSRIHWSDNEVCYQDMLGPLFAR